MDNETQAFLALLTAQHHHTATSIAYMLKAHAAPPPTLNISTVDGTPPRFANAYSDGSVRHPNTTFSTATFGVFWPGRAHSNISDLESDFATYVDLGPAHREAGLALAGSVHGIFHSSARAELVAAIVALLHATPTALKSDSNSIVTKALALAQRCSPGKRPWPLHKDGDLWEIFAKVIDSRGTSAQTIAWTKGHATLEHILGGTVSAKDAVFNSLADKAADRAHATPSAKCMHSLLAYYAGKQRCYVQIIRAICKRIARVAQAASDQLEAIGKARTASNSTDYIDTPAVTTTNSSEAINLSFVALPPLALLDTEVQAAAEVRIFWQRLRVVPIDVATGVGITWLELHALFSLRGGNAIGKPSAAMDHLRQTHAARYKAFIRRSKQLFAFADSATQPLLKPHLLRHAGNRQPLARYGLLGNFSQLPFQLQLGDQLLHAALCSYGGKVRSAERIPLRLRSAQFKAPRFAPWQHLVQAAILPEAALRLIARDNKMYPEHVNVATITRNEQQSDHASLPDAASRLLNKHKHENQSNMPVHLIDCKEFLLSCRSCNATSDMLHKTLYRHGKCLYIYCRHCHKGATAAKWSCGCGRAWIACPRCRPIGFSCKAKARKRGSASLTSSGTAPHPPPTPKRRRSRPTIGSADFRGRGNYRAFRKPITNNGKASAAFADSSLTTSGCNYVGPYSLPLVPARSFVRPSSRESSPVTPGPSPSKVPTLGCTQICMNSSGSNPKRALEATGGDGRTPKMIKTCGHFKTCGQQHSKDTARVSPCVRGTGLCPMTGWTIDQYCPSCHG